jgi:hypothetical protein
LPSGEWRHWEFAHLADSALEGHPLYSGSSMDFCGTLKKRRRLCGLGAKDIAQRAVFSGN